MGRKSREKMTGLGDNARIKHSEELKVEMTRQQAELNRRTAEEEAKQFAEAQIAALEQGRDSIIIIDKRTPPTVKWLKKKDRP